MQDDKINDDDFEDLDFENIDDDDLGDDDASPLEGDDNDLDADLDDDFPDDDDFTDEDWGDEEMATDKTRTSGKKNGGSTKRSSKMILPLAIGVVVIGAGGFYLMQNTGAGIEAPQQMPIDDMASADSNLDITEDSLPMPSPMTSPEGDEFDAQSVEGANNATVPALNADGMFGETAQDTPPSDTQAGTFADENVLTPMPGLQDSQADSAVPLEALGLETPPDTNVDNFDVSPQPSAEINSDLNRDPMLSAPPELSSDEPLEQSADIGIPTQPMADAGFDLDTRTSTISVDAQESEDADVSQINVTEYEEKINILEDNLNNKDNAISQLNAEIEALKEQLSASERALKETQNSLTAIKNKPEPITDSPANDPPKVVAKKPSSPAPASKPTPASQPEIQPKWELRAAQPGRAYIGITGSKNTQVIETGDTLQGIGRIESIALENGIWVVKGSNGTIKQ